MRISKRLILKVAEELRERQGNITQIAVHDAIEKKLGRQLTQGEKVRITLILRNELSLKKVERDKKSYSRIFYFL